MCSSIIPELCNRIHRQLFAVQKRTDSYNSGPLVIHFAAENLDQKSPMDAHFDMEKNATVLDQLFGKQSSHTILERLIAVNV